MENSYYWTSLDNCRSSTFQSYRIYFLQCRCLGAQGLKKQLNFSSFIGISCIFLRKRKAWEWLRTWLNIYGVGMIFYCFIKLFKIGRYLIFDLSSFSISLRILNVVLNENSWPVLEKLALFSSFSVPFSGPSCGCKYMIT